MREDQYLRLQVLSEELTDALLEELDPAEWPAAGILPKNLTKDQRGDRYWSKKNAAATLTLIMKTESLINYVQQPEAAVETGETGDTQVDIDREIDSAEQKAARLLDKVEQQRLKREFDQHILGKHGAH
jgi:hypothetical protein